MKKKQTSYLICIYLLIVGLILLSDRTQINTPSISSLTAEFTMEENLTVKICKQPRNTHVTHNIIRYLKNISQDNALTGRISITRKTKDGTAEELSSPTLETKQRYLLQEIRSLNETYHPRHGDNCLDNYFDIRHLLGQNSQTVKIKIDLYNDGPTIYDFLFLENKRRIGKTLESPWLSL